MRYINFIALFLSCLFNKKSSHTLIFKIKNINKTPIRNGYICIQSLKTKKFFILKTDSNGRAIMRNICCGLYKVKACGDGYKDKFFNINVCKDRAYNINLCEINYSKNRIYGYIRDDKNKIIENALVVLYEVIGDKKYRPIKFTNSDFTGEYNFIDVPKGTYIVKGIK